MDDKIQLEVVGLSYSNYRSTAHILILAAKDRSVHIPVVIGPAEARSIAVVLQRVATPRPLVYDVFSSFSHAFGVRLLNVFIYKYEDGIFSSEMTFTDGSRTVVLDTRTSDAIAIAIRTGSPIYTTRAILDETGYDIEQSPLPAAAPYPSAQQAQPQAKDENLSLKELEAKLATLIQNEDYEEAARIKRIIDNKNTKQ